MVLSRGDPFQKDVRAETCFFDKKISGNGYSNEQTTFFNFSSLDYKQMPSFWRFKIVSRYANGSGIFPF